MNMKTALSIIVLGSMVALAGCQNVDKVTDQEKVISTLVRDVIDLNSKVSSLESKISDLESKISDLESTTSDLESTTDNLEYSVDDLESNINSLMYR